MGIFNSFALVFGFSKDARTTKKAVKIRDITSQLLLSVPDFTSDYVTNHIPIWDLSNPYLRRYLGYIAGVLDAGAYALGRSKYDELAIEMVFHGYITRTHSDMPNVTEFLSANETSLRNQLDGEYGGSGFIGGLQTYSGFVETQLAGGREFLGMLEASQSQNPGWMPIELLRLFIVDEDRE